MADSWEAWLGLVSAFWAAHFLVDCTDWCWSRLRSHMSKHKPQLLWEPPTPEERAAQEEAEAEHLARVMAIALKQVRDAERREDRESWGQT